MKYHKSKKKNQKLIGVPEIVSRKTPPKRKLNADFHVQQMYHHSSSASTLEI